MSWDGFLVIDKPLGMSSRDVVNRAAGWVPKRWRIGHTGTLDPLATGELVLAVGQGTRLAEYVQDQPKVYWTEVFLGASTTTDDSEGERTPGTRKSMPDRAEVEAALAGFLGLIEQTPPAFSAAHIGGRRAYRLARQGRPELPAPRMVRVDRIDILRFDPPILELEIECGKGTYIRSLARDLGQKLETGAYVASLRRLRVGPFLAAFACDLDATTEEAARHLRPLEDGVVALPRVDLDADVVRRLIFGQMLKLPPGRVPWPSGDLAVFDAERRLRLIAKWDAHHRAMKPSIVMQGS